MFRLPLLDNGCADCMEIWYALGDPLVTAYAVVTGGVSLHVRTCTPRFSFVSSAVNWYVLQGVSFSVGRCGSELETGSWSSYL